MVAMILKTDYSHLKASSKEMVLAQLSGRLPALLFLTFYIKKDTVIDSVVPFPSNTSCSLDLPT